MNNEQDFTWDSYWVRGRGHRCDRTVDGWAELEKEEVEMANFEESVEKKLEGSGSS